jgi:hypothetical protein
MPTPCVVRLLTAAVAPAVTRPAPGHTATRLVERARLIWLSSQDRRVATTALTTPEDLGVAVACWSLDRLAVYLNQVNGHRPQARPHRRGAGGRGRAGSARASTSTSRPKRGH